MKKIYVATGLVIFISILLISYLLYTPPLLDEGGYNIPGRIYDFFAYAYYSTRMEWLDKEGDPQPRRRAVARAAWHRPDRIKELLGIPPGELFQLGREYAGLGLDKEAVRLFRAAFPSARHDEELSLEIISYLAILGDWPGTAQSAKEILSKYPDSAESEYWWGRAFLEMNQSDRSVTHLQRSFQLQPDQMDMLFQIGRLEEQAGNMNIARSLYERVVDRAPGHLGAWKGLVRLYEEGGDLVKLKEARRRCAGLVPPVSVKKKYGNSFILSGYGLPEGMLTTGGLLELEIYLNGWRPRSVSLRPETILSEPGRPNRYTLTGEVMELPGSGEVVKKRLSWNLPMVLYPGPIDWGLTFTDLVPLDENKAAVIKRWWFPLPSFSLNPGWTSAVDRSALVRKYFGAEARAMGKSTFLGPGEELELNFSGGEMAGGIGLVSYLHGGASVRQGAEAGRILVKAEDGDDQAYPIIAGRDTAEVWREFAPPWQKKHQLAPIFISWQVDSGKKQFQAHEYYAILTFPRPFVVKSLKFINCSDKSGWYISNIVMVPPGDKAGS